MLPTAAHGVICVTGSIITSGLAYIPYMYVSISMPNLFLGEKRTDNNFNTVKCIKL